MKAQKTIKRHRIYLTFKEKSTAKEFSFGNINYNGSQITLPKLDKNSEYNVYIIYQNVIFLEVINKGVSSFYGCEDEKYYNVDTAVLAGTNESFDFFYNNQLAAIDRSSGWLIYEYFRTLDIKEIITMSTEAYFGYENQILEKIEINEKEW